MTKLRLTLACWNYDRTRALQDGRVRADAIERNYLDLPASIKVQPIGPNDTLSAMLRDGTIDALYTARMPSSFRRGDNRVRRLFDDYVGVEREYFRRTRIFPIMHVVAMRRDVYEENRWIAQSLYKAFCAAQRLTYADLEETAAQKVMLPWTGAYVEEARRELGGDVWPYGFEANRDVLTTFLRYHHEQGLSRRRLEPAELFAPERLESFRI